MFERGFQFLLKVEEQKLFFNNSDFLPVEKVFLYLAEEREIESFTSRYPGIRVRVRRFSAGVLDCEIIDFKPFRSGFREQVLDFSKVRKLRLSSSDTLRILNLATLKPLEPPPPKPQPVAKQKPTAPRPRPVTEQKPPAPKPPPKPPKPTPPKEFCEEVAFKVPLAKVRFAEGAAHVHWGGRLPKSGRQVGVEVSMKNSFLGKRLNCIKPYLAKCLGDKVAVRATIRVRGGKAEVLKVESEAIASISSKMIGEVRYHYAKGELRKLNRHAGRIITAEDFFKKIKGAGFGDSDRDFIADILRVKAPKHSAHIEYLAERHCSEQVRLRIVKSPFAFLCFLEGTAGGFFVWETLDGTDATYLWKYGKSLDYLKSYRQEFKRWLVWVERQIDYIHAAGRSEYLRSGHEGFARIIHNYREENGFGKWKVELEKLLDGAGK